MRLNSFRYILFPLMVIPPRSCLANCDTPSALIAILDVYRVFNFHLFISYRVAYHFSTRRGFCLMLITIATCWQALYIPFEVRAALSAVAPIPSPLPMRFSRAPPPSSRCRRGTFVFGYTELELLFFDLEDIAHPKII